MRGGRRAGSGRKKNSPNKASAHRERAAAASGPTPSDVMLRSMRLFLTLAEENVADKKEFERYIRAAASIAKDAAPYFHPRLTAVEHPPGGPGIVRHIVQVTGGLPHGSTPENPGGDDYPEVPPEEKFG
jgi:hypothetical protein